MLHLKSVETAKRTGLIRGDYDIDEGIEQLVRVAGSILLKL